jgi:aminoglycoside phosphotransferase family enzyme/predicted kinase
MELTDLISALSEPSAYPDRAGQVEVVQTHISVVFLVGEHVYKVKKPLKLGFVDFGTLDKRRHFCEEEVRLNARLAPEVYLGVVPIVARGSGVRVAAPGEPIEWAVKMQRLPDEATLESRLLRGGVGAELIAAVGRRIAAFHSAAETSPRIAAFGRFEVVARNARDNFEQSRAHVGTTISGAVFDRLRSRTDEVLAEQRWLIDARAARGVPRDTHGDLRLDHVYILEDTSPPRMLIIDCVEFNEGFRFADPVADMAFLAMDLKFEGRADLAAALAEAWFGASRDDEGRALLPLYTSYRAAVRGKVEGFRQAEPEVPDAARAEALARARGYWLLALVELEPPRRKPCLVLVGGLPGTGKSTLAAALAQRGGYRVIRSDVVRKELAGVPPEQQAGHAFGGGIYTLEWNERTYAECLRRAEELLFEGQRVIVDASFREDASRAAFLEAARRWRVPCQFLVCQAAPQAIRARLAARTRDVSDADWTVYQQAAAAWEDLSPATHGFAHTVPSDGTPQQTLAAAVAVLCAAGLES